MSYMRWGLVVVVLATVACSSGPGAEAPDPAASAGTPAERGSRLESRRVAAAPVVDGDGRDQAWASAPELTVHVGEVYLEESGKTPVCLKSVYTATHVFFLIRWSDTTADTTHKTWVWDEVSGRYGAGGDREDVLALALELAGPFDAKMLSGVEAVWDVWQWKAARTDPAGYAMDKTHSYTAAKPGGKAKEFEVRGDPARTMWIARPEDEGDSPQRSQPAPEARGADRVPQYVPGVPSGSAADVRAKGRWVEGQWTVELSRRLDTGHPDDAVLSPGSARKMAVAVFDRAEHIHHRVSEVIELSLVDGARR